MKINNYTVIKVTGNRYLPMRIREVSTAILYLNPTDKTALVYKDYPGMADFLVSVQAYQKVKDALQVYLDSDAVLRETALGLYIEPAQLTNPEGMPIPLYKSISLQECMESQS